MHNIQKRIIILYVQGSSVQFEREKKGLEKKLRDLYLENTLERK